MTKSKPRKKKNPKITLSKILKSTRSKPYLTRKEAITDAENMEKRGYMTKIVKVDAYVVLFSV